MISVEDSHKFGFPGDMFLRIEILDTIWTQADCLHLTPFQRLEKTFQWQTCERRCCRAYDGPLIIIWLDVYFTFFSKELLENRPVTLEHRHTIIDENCAHQPVLRQWRSLDNTRTFLTCLRPLLVFSSSKWLKHMRRSLITYEEVW